MTHSNRKSAAEKSRSPGGFYGATAAAPEKPPVLGNSGQTEDLGDIEAQQGTAVSVPPRVLVEFDSSPHIYPPMIELFRQGDPANDVFLIERGLVKLTRLESNGREVIVDLRFPGWLLGAASVILKQPHAVSAITLTSSYLHRIPASAFQQLVNTNGLVSLYIHQMHSRDVHDKVRHVAQLGCLTARERLFHLLHRLTPEPTDGESTNEVRIQLPLKYWELAQLIAITPEHLSRLVKRLQDKGVLRQEKNWLILKTKE
jgi:CRP/FNR family transcriptional regulator